VSPENHPMRIDWKVKLYGGVHQPVLIIGSVFQLVASCEAGNTVSAVSWVTFVITLMLCSKGQWTQVSHHSSWSRLWPVPQKYQERPRHQWLLYL